MISGHDQDLPPDIADLPDTSEDSAEGSD